MADGPRYYLGTDHRENAVSAMVASLAPQFLFSGNNIHITPE
jgi:hypothetical protein